MDIKTGACYYFDDFMKVLKRDIDFSDILSDEKLYKEKYENILIYLWHFMQNFYGFKTIAHYVQ